MIECLQKHPLEKVVYLDNNATTKVAPEVAEFVVHYFLCDYGNSESSHSFGSNLQYVEKAAKDNIAKLLNGNPNNFYFTSGATESNNWALKGIMKRSKKKHLIISQIEHPSVLNVAKELERDGYDVTYLPVTKDGVVTLENLADAIRDDTALVSIMYANNETGAIMPIHEIGDYLKDKMIVFHTDATQAVGKIPVNIKANHIDVLSLSGHKFHAPKGIGSLYINPRKRVIGEDMPWRIDISAYMTGGEQQTYMRGGTMNTPLIAGMGKAAELSDDYLNKGIENVALKRDQLQEFIERNIPDTIVNAKNALRVPNTLNITIPGAEGESIIDRLSEVGICVSSGSACTSKSLAIPYVLDAMAIDHSIINSTIRFSLSRYTTNEEIKYVMLKLPEVIGELRRISGYTIKNK